MIEFIWQNFGLIELILCTEIIVLLTAAFFYQVARIIARTDRHDPLVRFYRVFWLAFLSPVTRLRELDARQAEYAARAAGVAGPGDMSREQLTRLDAPDLVDLDAVGLAVAEPSEAVAASEIPPAAGVRPIGRTGSENDPRLRAEPPAESRELRFAQRPREAEPPVPLDEDRPLPVMREPAAAPRGPVVPAGQVSVTGTFDVLINPFQPAARVVGFRGGEVVIDVTLAPEDGQANGVIITLMAERLNVRPYQLVLLRGHYKVRKTLQVAGIDQQILDIRLARL